MNIKQWIYLLGLTVGTAALADTADVLKVEKKQAEDKTWSFSVTVAHTDTGWEDYANGWDVVLPDGTMLKRNPNDPFTRLLLHPHVDEQPFTRSQFGLTIPEGITEVTVKAHTTVGGWGGKELVVQLQD